MTKRSELPDEEPVKTRAEDGLSPARHRRRRAIPTPTGRRPARRPGRPKPDRATALRLVEITLTARHGINGTNYGPGRVKVREDLAAVLMEQETRRKRERDRFYSKDRAFIVGQGRRPHRVAYDTFDDSWTAAGPVGAVHGLTLKVGGF